MADKGFTRTGIVQALKDSYYNYRMVAELADKDTDEYKMAAWKANEIANTLMAYRIDVRASWEGEHGQ